MNEIANPVLAQVIRNGFVECRHRGAAVVLDASGGVVAEWGAVDQMILPRSSCKMLQALPLIESGAAEAHRLGPEQLALACASHQGARIHTDRVSDWLAAMDMSDADLRCGPQVPDDKPARAEMRAEGREPRQMHNNCSGKHTGFLTLGRHLGAGPEYIEPDHPVQVTVAEAFAEMTETPAPLFHAPDGCSAPNFGTTIRGLALAMAKMARPDQTLSGARAAAASRLISAMAAHPDLVAGEGRACTELMQGLGRGAVFKTGAEGVFAAILPEPGLGVAVKIDDGATRASECALSAILVHIGVATPDQPMLARRLRAPLRNRRKLTVGEIAPGDVFQ